MTVKNEQEYVQGVNLDESSPDKKSGFFSKGSKSKKTSLNNKPKKEKKVKTRPILVPDYLLMGFQVGVSKKDLLLYLRSKASEIGDPDLAKYQILKKDGGFYWELHDCGSGHGILKDVLLKLETESSVVVKTSRKPIRISRNKKGGGLSIAILTDDTTEVPTEGVQYKDKMSSMNSSGTGLLVFSSIFALLGILSVLCAATFKYGILNKEKEVELPVVKVLPYSQIGAIEEFINNKEKVRAGEYVEKLELNSNKEIYVVYKGKEEVVTPPDSVKALGEALSSESATEESMAEE